MKDACCILVYHNKSICTESTSLMDSEKSSCGSQPWIGQKKQKHLSLHCSRSNFYLSNFFYSVNLVAWNSDWLKQTAVFLWGALVWEGTDTTFLICEECWVWALKTVGEIQMFLMISGYETCSYQSLRKSLLHFTVNQIQRVIHFSLKLGG